MHIRINRELFWQTSRLNKKKKEKERNNLQTVGKSNLKPETRWIPQRRRSCWWKFNISWNFVYPQEARFLFAFDPRCLLWTSFNKSTKRHLCFFENLSRKGDEWNQPTNPPVDSDTGARTWLPVPVFLFFFFPFFIPLTSISFLTLSPLFKTEIKRMSVFKNYEAGEPTCRLYVKNIAKQVEEKVGPAVACDPLSSIPPDLFFVCFCFFCPEHSPVSAQDSFFDFSTFITVKP